MKNQHKREAQKLEKVYWSDVFFDGSNIRNQYHQQSTLLPKNKNVFLLLFPNNKKAKNKNEKNREKKSH